jgi:SAM-dependent methyltransferase
MVMSTAGDRKEGRSPGSLAATPAEVVWHELECGSYSVDLALWQELAGLSPGPILDVGAGSGRVALELARAGHEVTALDLSPVLLAALQRRASGLGVETIAADARSFVLSRSDFALCVVPMQTIQLLGGAAGRIAFLRRARAHLREGGLLACALLADVEPFSCAKGDVGPVAERAQVDGVLYVSRPTRVALLEQTVLIERERRIIGAREGSPDLSAPPAATSEINVIELDRVSAQELEQEALQAGLHAEPAREVSSTSEHVGSVVVMLRA